MNEPNFQARHRVIAVITRTYGKKIEVFHFCKFIIAYLVT